MGITWTNRRVAQNFFWPGMGKQIAYFCKTCDVYQRWGTGQDRTKAKLCPLSVISTPFQRLRLDLVGPLPNTTRRGNKYILTIMDFATRYPEAIPLRNMETDTVADVLINYTSRLGFASKIVSDLGTNFTSKLIKRLWKACGITQINSTPYHPETNDWKM